MQKTQAKRHFILKWAILAIAAASCTYGALSGEALAVLRKAAAVCLECCGIG